MTSSDPAQAYRRAAIENAPPLKLVQMLYQGALRFLGEAAVAHAADDLPRFTSRVARAQLIVNELRSSLDGTSAPELCERLEGLYLFATGRLTEAVVEACVEPLAEVEDIFRTLLSAWRDLEHQEDAA